MNEGYQASQRTRMAQAAVAQAIQKAMGGSGQIPTQFSQAAPARPPMPAQRPQAPQQPPQQVGAGPGAIQVQPMPPAGGVGNGTTMPGAAPAAVPPGVQPAQAAATPSPQPQAVAAQNGAQAGRSAVRYQDALKELMNDPSLPLDVRQEAMGMMQKQIDAEAKRESDAEQKTLDREAKGYQQLQAIEAKFRMAQAAGADRQELESIRGEYRLKEQELRNTGAANVAGMNIQGRKDVAGMNIGSREGIEAAKIASREGLELAKLEYKKQFDSDTLELKADSQAKNFLLKSRQLDLMDKGLTQKQAQFVAKLEQDKEIATMRDATTQRGQTLMNERAEAARQGKLDIEEAKVAATIPAVIDGFDKVYKTAEIMLNHPGMDDALGPIAQYIFSVDGDTIAFEGLIKTLQAQVGFQELANMRATSPTGGALGNVSNKEVEFLQATIRSLDPRQDSKDFINNLREIMDNANKAKARTLQAYETRFGAGKPKGGDVPAAATAPKANGETRDIPTELKGEPNGTIVRDGAKTFMVKDGKLVETGG